ncbi:MAG: LCP family protein [Clostridia bacterium]|nr:LCP family protein [Clostridia bacterium]
MSRKEKKMNLFLKILLILFISILIIVITMISTAYFYLKNKLGKVEYVDIPKSEIIVNQGVTDSLATYRNIALFGIDARSDTFGTGNRSDCIMIISLNEKTNDVKIMSVYRDTYLNIDGHGLDKVTHAYSYGGPKLALNTLNQNLDLNITEFVAINFDTVRTVVDSVHGIQMNLDSQEVKYINSYINSLNKQFGTSSKNINKSGTYTLDGVQALAYCRIRYTDGGDYKRTERMRDVLTAVFNKAKTMGVGELNNLADTILPHVSTNLKENEIIGMIPKIASFNVSDSFGWPYKTKGITKDRWYGVPVDLESNVSQLHKELFGAENYEPTDTVKNISDKIVKNTGYKK